MKSEKGLEKKSIQLYENCSHIQKKHASVFFFFIEIIALVCLSDFFLVLFFSSIYRKRNGSSRAEGN